MGQAAGSANFTQRLSPHVIVTYDLLKKPIGRQAQNTQEGKSKEKESDGKGWGGEGREKVIPSIGAAKQLH